VEHPTQTHLNTDSRPARRPFGFRRVHFHVAIAVAVGLGVIALFGPSRNAEATRSLEAAHLTVPLAVPETPAGTSVEVLAAPTWQTITIKPGDSLAGIFDRVGLGPDVLHAVIASGPDAQGLKHLLPGEVLRFDIQSGQLQRLDYTMDPMRTLAVQSNDGGYAASLLVQTPEVRVAQSSGVIESSLYAAGLRSGLSDALIMQLAEVFGWDIDFALDLRAGDRFSVLYEERFVDGKKLGSGDILAAEFINDGRKFQAIKYTDPAGHSDYYSADGRSMRKAFLRSPVDFRRISSRFQSERYHPVLGVKRPHRGVDYAASIGTPIKASGDGKVVFAGTKGGYGRTVIVQHGGTYSTLYGHLSRFNKSTRVGARVRQGQTIGYVGKTGVATGPHLHYEFRVNGVHRNPLTVKLPSASPIGVAYKADFYNHASGMLARLAIIDQVQVATSEP
jgi:murein DD-endopeptidase MepM/ murein hydrolase activator NlpD